MSERTCACGCVIPDDHRAVYVRGHRPHRPAVGREAEKVARDFWAALAPKGAGRGAGRPSAHSAP